MKYLFSLLLVLSVVLALGQESTPDTSSIKQYNMVKIGGSAQVNISFYSRYDYYYYESFYYGGGYYYDDIIYETGGNEHIFLAYEHVWDFTKKSLALGIEPQIGFSYYSNNSRYLSTAYTGVRFKFYWLSKPNFRMGLATYFGYTYANRESTVSVPMEGGMYHQNRQLTTHYNQFSGDISLIPFQFRIKNSPISIESQFALFGLNVTKVNSEKYDSGYDENYSYQDVIPSIFALKFELRIGFEF